MFQRLSWVSEYIARLCTTIRPVSTILNRRFIIPQAQEQHLYKQTLSIYIDEVIIRSFLLNDYDYNLW